MIIMASKNNAVFALLIWKCTFWICRSNPQFGLWL